MAWPTWVGGCLGLFKNSFFYSKSYDNEDCAVFGRFDFNIAIQNFSSHSISCTLIKSSS
jgi:hypothetical protein